MHVLAIRHTGGEVYMAKEGLTGRSQLTGYLKGG